MKNLNTSRKACRSRRWYLLWIVAGLTAVLPRAAYAIDPNRAMSQYVRDHFGVEQGFPAGPVYAIAQTDDGYLWIGTERGLVRFDGWSFTLVKDKSGTLGNTSVLGLAADDEGNLWLRLLDLTLRRYRDGVFSQPATEPFSRITTMTRSRQGELVVWKMEDGAFIRKHDGFHRDGGANEMPRSPVISLAHSPDGGAWMGTRDAGLFRLFEGKATSIRKGLPDPKINCLLADGDHDLWVGTDNGIVRWDGTGFSSGTPASFNHFQALAIAKDRDANIWVGTDSRGLLRFNSSGVATLDASGERAHEAVTAVFEDREGNLWIGSASGLERLRDSAFVTYSQAEGLPSDGSTPIFVDGETRMWFGAADGSLWWVKDEQHGRVVEEGLEHDVVYSIAGRNDELWLGRRRGGLTRLRSGPRGLSAQTYTQKDGLTQNSVYSVYVARDGTVWAGTLSGGLSKFSGGRFTNYTSDSGLVSNTVTSILEGADGAMWFATADGLSRLANGAWKSYTVQDGLPSNNVNCLMEDATGVLWIGTAAGLGFRASGKFQVAANLAAPLHEQIFGIAEDRNGSLWLATSNHVLRVARDKLLRGVLTEGDLREYGVADGLRGIEGVKRHRSVVTDQLGRIWFSTNHGISVADPSRLVGRAAPSLPHIETISADGLAIDTHSPIRIPAGRRRIIISYSGLNFAVPDRVRFRFSLDGFEHGWSEPVARRETSYTNLGPGFYRFHLVASDPEGTWSPKEAQIGFEITPLFWQSSWFRVACLLCAMIAIAVVYRYRLHRLTRQLNLRFEERLAERTRIAQELHDTLLQGFLSASMQLHVAADQLPADSPAKPRLERVLELVSQVIDEGRNAVRGLRSSRSSSLDLEQSLSQIPQELGLQEEIGFRVILEGDRRPLRPLLRDEVYRIGREALVNAFRHSQAKSIEIELEYTPNYLRMLVRDNGLGIDPQVLRTGREGHWGLQGMHERAERIGAKLHVWSSATAGTEIELSIPSHIAFQGSSTNGRLKWFSRLRPRQDVDSAKDTKNRRNV